MPTYEYQCETCGLKFDCQQAITALPLTECPECHANVRRLVSGGSGFIIKEDGSGRTEQKTQACSLEQTGITCCGQEERCGKAQCGA